MAQLPEQPQLATTPLELFEYRYPVEESVLSKIWAPVSFGLVSFTAVCYANWATKRPVLSGTHNLKIVFGHYIIFLCRYSKAHTLHCWCRLCRTSFGGLETPALG